MLFLVKAFRLVAQIYCGYCSLHENNNLPVWAFVNKLGISTLKLNKQNGKEYKIPSPNQSRKKLLNLCYFG